MKNILQGIGFVVIVIGGFWVGMQWGSLGNSTTPPPAIEYQHVAPIATPSETVETTQTQTATSTGEVPVPPPVLVENTPETITAPVTVSTTPGVVDIPTPKNDKVVHYQSNYFKYGFDVPASVYYSAFSGEDGAQHTVGIAKEIPDTLADAAVRVYFYGKKIVPELQNSQKYSDPAGKFIYILLNGQYSVKIEANDINNPIVQTIVGSLAIQ